MKKFLKQINNRINEINQQHSEEKSETRQIYLEGKLDELHNQKAEFENMLKEHREHIGYLMKGLQDIELDQEDMEEVYSYIEEYEQD